MHYPLTRLPYCHIQFPPPHRRGVLQEPGHLRSLAIGESVEVAASMASVTSQPLHELASPPSYFRSKRALYRWVFL